MLVDKLSLPIAQQSLPGGDTDTPLDNGYFATKYQLKNPLEFIANI